MSEVSTTPATNGVARPAFRDRLAEEIRGELARLDARREELAAELSEIAAEMKSYQRSLAPLVDEPDETKPRLGRPPGSSKVRPVASKIGPQRIAQIKASILEIVDGDDIEFQQIEVRERTGLSSGVIANAFRQLREDEQFIRFARKDGGRKFFRLTRPALGGKIVEPIRPPKDETRQVVLDAVRHYGRPATLAAISEITGVGDVALRNAVHTLQVEGVIEDVGPAEVRADGQSSGRMPRTYAPAEQQS